MRRSSSPKDKTGNNYASFIDRTLDKWYDEMNRESDPAKQAATMRMFEKRVLWEQSHFMINYWWFKINPHRSYVKAINQAIESLFESAPRSGLARQVIGPRENSLQPSVGTSGGRFSFGVIRVDRRRNDLHS